MYATKRRRRNVKTYKHATPKENQKSNPSKRHRERLNAELENLANLLPFEQTILTKLDKLSILRLAVSYLRIKSYFQVKLKISNYLPLSTQQQQENERIRYPQLYYMDPHFSEGNAILDSLNGFMLIANSNSEVFYASRTVEQFLGFHQSDIIHQSIAELIHSEDREEFKRQLSWNLKLPIDKSDITLNDMLTKKEYSKYLDRNFTVRFRCLLDNTSGFVTLDIVGRLSILYGQRHAIDVNNDQLSNHHMNAKPSGYKAKNSKIMNNISLSSEFESEPVLALFAVAVPFGPPSLFELPQRDSLFRTKHKVNLAPLTIDPRGKLVLGYSEQEFTAFTGYELIHMDDLKYYYNAHKELLKTGSCGLVCYRLLNKDQNWQWIQSSMRIIYKSNKPECIIANHRPLTAEEGEELYYKRGLEFKLPYPCLYDFEANFANSIGNTSNNNNTINTTAGNSSCNFPLDLNADESFHIPTKQPPPAHRLSTASANKSNSTSNPHHQVPKSGGGVSKTKAGKNNKVRLQKCLSNTIQQQQQQQQQLQSQLQHSAAHQQQQQPAASDGYFGGFSKLESLANNYTAPFDATPLEYQALSSDNGHHYANYTNYFNSLNGYNYTNYTTPYTIYSPHQTSQSTPNTFNEFNQVASTPQTWFDGSTGQTANVKSGYSLLNYPNSTNQAAAAYSYNDLFSSSQAVAAAKYAAVVDNFDKTSAAAAYYLDEYQHSTPHPPYEYNTNSAKFSQITKSVANPIDSPNSSNNFNVKKEHQNAYLLSANNNTSSSPSSVKASSCSSTSASPVAIQTSVNHLQDHNNNTNGLFLASNDYNSKYNASNSSNKKYESFQNELKVQPASVQDRNSLQSFSTSSSCSSASSSSLNYCDESAVKSFIKQENCMIELAVGLNNTNNMRNGFLKDYYSDYYQNNVSI